MEAVADYLNIEPIDVYEVGSFYSMFTLKPAGKHHVSVCTNISCMLRGGDEILQCIEKKLGIKMGQTTQDMQFTLTEVECMGACVNAPMVQINDDYYEDLTPEVMEQLIESMKGNSLPVKGPQNGRLNSMNIDGPTSLKDEAKKAKVI